MTRTMHILEDAAFFIGSAVFFVAMSTALIGPLFFVIKAIENAEVRAAIAAGM